MSDQSVVQPEAAAAVATETPAATETPVSTDAGTAATETESTATSSPLEQAKAKFDAFVEFVEHGLEVLGEEAEADLVALKDKFL
ncbi:Ig domain protein group 1 domain protein [Tatumella sp. UCD-D_suzukii]|uniref:Ig domain protein group 1 domain protein n=1 Tax=Tatumella sp. UCD-D_suzukii TaxID=1408192 RepID=UPI00136489EF|nr:Ig domain protein group 1 domain protein [Tatumella sp. UCD-D_suzukii]